MKRSILALCLLLLASAPAEAQRGLTAAEKDEARKAYNAQREMHLALEDLAAALVERTATAHAAIGQVWYDIHRSANGAGIGSYLLIGINSADLGTAAENREAAPRATWVADAWSQHDGAIFDLATGVTDIDVALAIGGQTGAYTTALTSAKARLTAARNYLLAINRTSFQYGQARNLPYCRDWAAAPSSTNQMRRGSCNVIGPHGNWVSSTHQMSLGFKSMMFAVNLLRDVYLAAGETAMPTSTNPYLADLLIAQARLAENINIVQYNTAIIPVTATQCTFTPFQLVARSWERLMQFGDTTDSTTSPAHGGPIAGNPFYFVARGNLVADLNGLNAALASRPAAHASLNAVLSEILQAWRWESGALWVAFEMPSDLQNYIVASDVPSGTTVFPYPWGVNRGSDLRVYVRSAGSTSNREPKTEGVHYTVSGVGNPAGGNVTISPAPADGLHVQIERVADTRMEELRRQPYPENDPDHGTVGPCS